MAMNPKTLMAILVTSLVVFAIRCWDRFKFETKHWQPWWHYVVALAVALLAGVTLLHALGMLDDYVALF